MPSLTFFIGKGGVGKTTLAAAFAVREATRARGRSVLLLSTDPAHSLGDLLQARLSSKPSLIQLSSPARLFAWQIDAQQEFGNFLDQHRESILELIDRGTFFNRKEIEPLLDAAIPGMAETAALLAIRRAVASDKYSDLVVDTAPVGHTLRLFEMPQHFAGLLKFLEIAASRDRWLAERFAGAAVGSARGSFLAEWGQIVSDLSAVLSASTSRIVLVTTPERFALNQSIRAARLLLRTHPDWRIGEIVLNRAISRAGKCRRCSARADETTAASRELRRHFPRVRFRVAEDAGAPIVGTRALLDFAHHVFERRRLHPPHTMRVPAVKFRRISWPSLSVPLSLTVGKGGVGKTTVSAALAFHHHHTSKRSHVVVVSTDPAPSLDDVFGAPIGDALTPVGGDLHLVEAMEVDAVAKYRAWASRLQKQLEKATATDKSGVHIDFSFDRRLISALLDIVPPGVDELLATFRIFDLLKSKKTVIVDMAPTGHALELLHTPDRLVLWTGLLIKALAPHRALAIARDLIAEVAAVSHAARRLAHMLRDRRRAQVWTVMLPEPLPDLETGRLLQALDKLGTPAKTLFINRVLIDEAPACRRCTLRRGWQMATLARLQRRYGSRRIFMINDFPGEISGARTLRTFVNELWQVE